ncbi:rRNA maturation RNase YbeY [Candidatus Omnitrophota bacterium]
MVIDIQNLQDKIKIDEQNLKKSAGSILKNMSEEESELSLLFVNDSYIKKLNMKYRDIDSKTDVLAFSMREGEGLSKKSPLLGDVVISVETAKREAVKRNRSVQKEILLYLTHGILHLLGYDDENLKERKKMKMKEKDLMGLI